MKLLVFGRGFVGERLARDVPGAVLHPADIADEVAVRAAIGDHQPDAVVNCAGKTGRPNVDWCETNQLPTFRSNVEGPLVLARVCAATSTYLLHIGSGCIFYGDSPSPGGWREDDFANPSSFYSRTKYAADLVLSKMPNVGIARLRMPIDSEPGARNLITKLAGYSQVIDVENSVTVIDDLVPVVVELARRKAAGVFHATNPGTMRHRELLELYKEIVDPKHEVSFISNDELVAKGLAKLGRSNCILADERLAALGITMRPVSVALRDAMQRYARAVRPNAPGAS